MNRLRFLTAALGWVMGGRFGYMPHHAGPGHHGTVTEKVGLVWSRLFGRGSAGITSGLRAAVILANFSDDVRQPWSLAYIDGLFNGASPSVADLYSQSSWGQFPVTFDVMGYYVVDRTISQCTFHSPIATLAKAAAIADGHDLSVYGHFLYVMPSTPTCGGGVGQFPGTDTWVFLDASVCYEGNPSGLRGCQSFGIIPHEFGHNFGLDHAGNYLCTDGAGTKVVVSSPGNCTPLEFGDLWDVMVSGANPALLSCVHRAQMGWIPSSRIVTITQTGDYLIKPSTDPGMILYRLDLGGGYFIYFENRRGVAPYDSTGYPNSNLLMRRALDYTAPGITGLLDGTPLTGGSFDYNLPVGNGFTLPNGTTTVANQSYDASGNVVHVGF